MRDVDPNPFVVDAFAEPAVGVQLPGPVALTTHAPDACEGRACVIHNPSDHHMREWRMNWRADRNLMERMCSHGVGHPDPDALAYEVSQGRSWQGVHGCDQCCSDGAA